MKDNIFKSIANNSFNNSLEEVLSKKNFSEDIKNTLLSIFYKLDNGYDDYKTVKRNTYEKKEYMQKITKIIDRNCENIIFLQNKEKDQELINKKDKEIKTIIMEETKMTDNITINQKSALGSETTQIANQNNYYGLTPAEASQMAIDLFMDNFPKLQEAAMKTILERVNEIIREIVSEIDAKYAGNYSAFSQPDMQYILVEAEKEYARKGTPELCAILSSLVANRSACVENSFR